MGMFDYVRFGTGIFEEDIIEFNGNKIDLLLLERKVFTEWQTKIRENNCDRSLLEIKLDKKGYCRLYIYEWDREKREHINPQFLRITKDCQIYSYFGDGNCIYINVFVFNSYVTYIVGNIHIAKEINDDLEYQYIPLKFKALKDE